MELIIGGAYQGKLAYARERFALEDGEIFECTDGGEPDRSARCVTHLERYVLSALRAGRTPEPDFRPDAVLLCDDISCGVVPLDPLTRAWREETGRFLIELAGRARGVTRIFCGLPLTLK